MMSFKFARFAVPSLTAAVIALGAQAALAQTTPAPSTTSQGSMSGMSMAAPSPAKTTHHMTAHALPTSEKFSTLSAAQAHCSSDVVVWANTGHSKLFHLTSSKYFGKTKHGAYVCQKSALAAGYHASKS
ncbi:hypothetical protein [Acidocella sp.]|uniref:hypothetical protein n=1 Tax=Acidocella sp. TaxID=50710 RepID=UPI002F41174A